MRAHRIVLATAAALVSSGLTAASGAPKVCLQVLDDANDAKAFSAVDAAPLDILSADLATGRKNLVAVMRLAALPPDPMQATGAAYVWTWSVGGRLQSVSYLLYATGERAGRFDANAASNAGAFRDEVDVPVVLDPSTKTITFTVPRALVSALRKPGARFGAFTVDTRSGAFYQAPNGEGRVLLAGGDRATSTKTYVDQTPSCLKGT